jgi:hypothetical protein
MSFFNYLKALDKKSQMGESFLKRLVGSQAKGAQHGVEGMPSSPKSPSPKAGAPTGAGPKPVRPVTAPKKASESDEQVHEHDKPPQEIERRPTPGNLSRDSMGPRGTLGSA